MRILIVDDEAPARRKLKRFVTELTTWQVVGEARSVASAIDAIEVIQPELVLLDIRLGDGSGFDVVKALEHRPRIVFVTAYDEYAVEAFDVHAQDYLLKPVERRRFLESVRRLESNTDLGLLNARLQEVLARIEAPVRYENRIYVEYNQRGHFLPLTRVSRIESARNYLVLHTARQQFRIRSTLAHLIKRLDPQQFARVNRSTVVNIDAVAEVQSWFRGDRLLIMQDGTEVRLGRRYLDASPLLKTLR